MQLGSLPTNTVYSTCCVSHDGHAPVYSSLLMSRDAEQNNQFLISWFFKCIIKLLWRSF